MNKSKRSWKGNLATLFNKNLLSKVGTVLCPTILYGRDRTDIIYEHHDYVRLSSLELVAHQIYENKIAGNVAELGVFQGEFAQYINLLFPDKKLYLFDTFDGFDKESIEKEKAIHNTTQFNDFSDTSVEMVLQKMKYKDNCIIKKGFFPDTAIDLEDSFSFVSIDTDLSEPIYLGLQYFYPRLSNGGYIFIHDFENIRYPGARAAVTQYCSENRVPYFVLSDAMGSAIICK